MLTRGAMSGRVWGMAEVRQAEIGAVSGIRGPLLLPYSMNPSPSIVATTRTE